MGASLSCSSSLPSTVKFIGNSISREKPVISCMRFDTTVTGEDLAYRPSIKNDDHGRDVSPQHVAQAASPAEGCHQGYGILC
jgi:hypothetical protein